MANAVSGVSSEGLSTTQQPAASAGATLRVTIENGKFQGVMAPVATRTSHFVYSSLDRGYCIKESTPHLFTESTPNLFRTICFGCQIEQLRRDCSVPVFQPLVASFYRSSHGLWGLTHMRH